MPDTSRPMNEAPRDGTPILAFIEWEGECDHRDHWRVMFWHKGFWKYPGGGGRVGKNIYPLRWWPLYYPDPENRPD